MKPYSFYNFYWTKLQQAEVRSHCYTQCSVQERLADISIEIRHMSQVCSFLGFFFYPAPTAFFIMSHWYWLTEFSGLFRPSWRLWALKNQTTHKYVVVTYRHALRRTKTFEFQVVWSVNWLKHRIIVWKEGCIVSQTLQKPTEILQMATARELAR